VLDLPLQGPIRIVHSEIDGNSATNVTLEGKLYTQRPERCSKGQHRTSCDQFFSDAYHSSRSCLLQVFRQKRDRQLPRFRGIIGTIACLVVGVFESVPGIGEDVDLDGLAQRLEL
jgi:hypothetical protein